MKKTMLVIALLIVAIVFTGCSCGNEKEKVTYSLDDAGIPVGNGYIIFKSSNHQIMIAQQRVGGFVVIPAKVVQCAFDERWVLAMQLSMELDPSNGVEYPTNETNYWILDTLDAENPELYGPYKAVEEFAAMRTELEVPEKLELKDVYYWEDNYPRELVK